MHTQQRFGVMVLGLAALALLLGAAGPAAADVVTFNYEAVVVASGTPFGFTVNNGDIVTGTFSWDTSAAPFTSGSTIAEYILPAPPASFVLNLTDDSTGLPHTISTPNPGGLFVAVISTGTEAIIEAAAFNSTFSDLAVSMDNGPAIKGELVFFLENSTQDVLGSTSLPATLDLGDFPDNVILVQDGSGDTFAAMFLSITPAAVPEPSSLALFALGGLALAGWRRWKGKRGMA